MMANKQSSQFEKGEIYRNNEGKNHFDEGWLKIS